MRHNNSKQAKTLRREQAEARNAAWNELSDTEQLIALRKRGGVSAKQVLRILRKMVA